MERFYESMIILRPDLTEEEREEVFAKISKKIEGLEGRVFESKLWAKGRNFVYPIRSRGAEKKKYFQGVYWLINFSLDTEKLKDLKETMRLEEKILRNLIVKRSVKENKKK